MTPDKRNDRPARRSFRNADDDHGLNINLMVPGECSARTYRASMFRDR